MRRRLVSLVFGLGTLLLLPGTASAQRLDLTVFGGRSFPVLDGDLVLRAPSVPSLPGVNVTAAGTPELRTDGGPVLGIALALEAGILGIEGRLDMTSVGFDVSGTRYDLRATDPSFQGLTGSVSIANGRLDVRRMNLVSLNLRLRTPGVVGLVASGGLSYLPEIEVRGSVPIDVELAGITVLPAIRPRLRLLAAPGESDHRWGVNAGAGLRVGNRVSLVAEARVFYFREHRLQFGVQNGVPFLDELLASIDSVGFEPVVANAQAGINIRF